MLFSTFILSVLFLQVRINNFPSSVLMNINILEIQTFFQSNTNAIFSIASCNDGAQNQGETDIDCGGPCAACANCNDKVQNQGETGVDCGGPCPACRKKIVLL